MRTRPTGSRIQTTPAGNAVEMFVRPAREFPTPARLLASACVALDCAVKAARLRPKGGGFLLGLNVVGDARIRTLNRLHRRKDKATDVLSFPLYVPGEAFPGAGPEPLGDVVISRDTCRRQAAGIGHSVADEFDRLLVHGILHLMGYDHETSKDDERRMQILEDRILLQMQK